MSVDDREAFVAANEAESAAQAADPRVKRATREWIRATQQYHYSYHFSWLGLPIIQYPPDIVAIQEIVWRVKPDLIIETGVARGGSLIFSASLLALLDATDMAEDTRRVSRDSQRRVVGIDVDLRPHNRSAIESHPLSRSITLIEGSSTDSEVVARVASIVEQHECVMVLLDSNHTHAHVLAELEAYSRFVSVGSYCVVFDTLIEEMPPEVFADRPWGPADNPFTAVREFLARSDCWVADQRIDDRLLISVAPGGFLRRIRNPGE